MAIMETLDPGAAEIWKIYGILAEIADREAAATADPRRRAELEAEARGHRRAAREAKRNFAGTRYELQQHIPLILATVMAVHEPPRRAELEASLPQLEKGGWTNLVAAIRRVLAGERDAEALYGSLDGEDSVIIETILQAISDPASLAELLPAGQAGGEQE